MKDVSRRKRKIFVGEGFRYTATHCWNILKTQCGLFEKGKGGRNRRGGDQTECGDQELSRREICHGSSEGKSRPPGEVNID